MNLSAKDMFEISQEISRDFTPFFSSPAPEFDEKIRLSPRELLDIGEEIGRDFAPKPSCNIPELMLFPVDPGHLYAFWNLGEDKDIPMPDNEKITLRIYSQSDDDEEAAAETVLWFDVAIDNPMTQQQVSLPCPVNETAYSAAIGKWGADDGFIAIAHSNIIHAPLRTAWYQDHQDFSYYQGKNASGLGINKQAWH